MPAKPGIYLLTVEFDGGYLIYAAGITSRPIPKRLREHEKAYVNGVYNVLDIDAMRRGERREVWHGFWMKPRPPERVEEFNARRDEIQTAARAQMQGFRVFTGTAPSDDRLPARIEAAVMYHLYSQTAPYGSVPDQGMFLAPRRESEDAVLLRNRCSSKLHCLPEWMLV